MSALFKHQAAPQHRRSFRVPTVQTVPGINVGGDTPHPVPAVRRASARSLDFGRRLAPGRPLHCPLPRSPRAIKFGQTRSIKFEQIKIYKHQRQCLPNYHPCALGAPQHGGEEAVCDGLAHAAHGRPRRRLVAALRGAGRPAVRRVRPRPALGGTAGARGGVVPVAARAAHVVVL
eukprot:scaffold67307_cov48-Phaeocystis_antarctica.AAC.2